MSESKEMDQLASALELVLGSLKNHTKILKIHQEKLVKVMETSDVLANTTADSVEDMVHGLEAMRTLVAGVTNAVDRLTERFDTLRKRVERLEGVHGA